jgi:hypothetical protein
MKQTAAILLSIVFFSTPVIALSPHSACAGARCHKDSAPGELCKVDLLELHPTQFAIGFRAMKKKEKEILQLEDEDSLKHYLKKHAEPTVIGPKGRLYIVDHHHLGRALLEAKIKATYAEILANWKNKSETAFWSAMKNKGWVFPYDENGAGPLPYEQLPDSLYQLRDDPYRSLAGEVRARGGYEKADVFYVDSLWANFFRARILIGPGDEGFEKAVKKALKLAQSPEARKLPGFIGSARP